MCLCSRWDYLERGIDQIMSSLREGVTMEIVSGTCYSYINYADMSNSIWESTRKVCCMQIPAPR